MLSRAEREELKALSLEIFGVSSKYTKFMSGESFATTEIDEVVPGEDGAEDTTRKRTIVKLDEKGRKTVIRTAKTFEETRDMLLGFKAQRDEYLAKMEENRLKAEAMRAEEARIKAVNAELAGSSVG